MTPDEIAREIIESRLSYGTSDVRAWLCSDIAAALRSEREAALREALAIATECIGMEGAGDLIAARILALVER